MLFFGFFALYFGKSPTGPLAMGNDQHGARPAPKSGIKTLSNDLSSSRLSNVMSLLEIARDTLKEIPMADVLRERLSLARDQFADAERKTSSLQSEVGALKAQLEQERVDHKQTQHELQRLKEEHAEEVRIHRSIEFRRGQRTSGKWMAFCPKCHLPAAHPQNQTAIAACPDGACKWQVRTDTMLLQIIGEIEL
jgi:hypothetical protein